MAGRPSLVVVAVGSRSPPEVAGSPSPQVAGTRTRVADRTQAAGEGSPGAGWDSRMRDLGQRGEARLQKACPRARMVGSYSRHHALRQSQDHRSCSRTDDASNPGTGWRQQGDRTVRWDAVPGLADVERDCAVLHPLPAWPPAAPRWSSAKETPTPT